mgnify:CR=1 FL=1
MPAIWADELETNSKVRFNTFDPGPVLSGFRARIYTVVVAKDLPDTETVVPS